MKKSIQVKLLAALMVAMSLFSCEDTQIVEPFAPSGTKVELPKPMTIKRGDTNRSFTDDGYIEDFKCSWFETYEVSKPWLNQVLYLDVDAPTVPYYFSNAKVYRKYGKYYSALIQPGGFVAMNFEYKKICDRVNLTIGTWNEVFEPDHIYPKSGYDLYIYQSGDWKLFKSVTCTNPQTTGFDIPLVLSGIAVAVVAHPDNIEPLDLSGLYLSVAGN
ncbi:hypothetical protein JMN32_16505 [Fulvivirga sp. 29W222]|uniref:Uncharacterized protein n=1 Tax=Fulvivirga marina TaxID=2494733 RepID=A0A937KCZ0_9BACT|nr:hypothetical protein [Fulvivirga marina]MBL6447919.1 hypothetical protein [Fulvivirga marina]